MCQMYLGLDDSISYNITVKDGQVIIANDNAVVNATNTVNGVNKDELVELINEIKLAAENSNLSSDDEETVNNSLEVIEEEIAKEKPRKGFIKTAITGLKAIKGTAEFGAAIATLIKFIQQFIG